MTAARRYGEDQPFGQWLREQKELDSHQHSFTANDADWIFHKYKTNVDSVGTREVQLMMVCETKTLNATPNPSQTETLFFHHQVLNTDGIKPKKLKRTGGRPAISFWHFGVYILRMSGLSPETSTEMYWGMFDENGSIQWKRINRIQSLIDILGFRRRPDSPTEWVADYLRRHHKTKQFVLIEKTPLGFETPVLVTKRS